MRTKYTKYASKYLKQNIHTHIYICILTYTLKHISTLPTTTKKGKYEHKLTVWTIFMLHSTRSPIHVHSPKIKFMCKFNTK